MASSKPLIKANITFTLDLFKELSEKNKNANLLFSPLGMSSGLAMLMLGARNKTEKQMAKYTQDCQDVHVSFAQLLSVLNKRDAAYALRFANRLYEEQMCLFSKDYLTAIKKHYNAAIKLENFQDGFEAARVKINSWVEEQTQGQIQDVLTEGMVDKTTKLVLVNAIYFKGTWNEPFLIVRTHDTQFRVNKNDTKPVRMMKQKSHFPLAKIPEANCQILEMPYKGKEFSMLIFLPNDMEGGTTGLEKLEKQLTYEKFVEWTGPDMMKEEEVEVSLPRFKMEENYDLNAVLKSMGMVDAFDDKKCDFSGIFLDKGIPLSKVAHKAVVEVTEEGTGAPDGVTMFAENYMLYLNVVNFFANHPFLYFIRHNPTMSVLLAGRFCSPE